MPTTSTLTTNQQTSVGYGLSSNRVINSNTDNIVNNRNFNPFSSDLYCIYGFLPSPRSYKSVRARSF